MDWVDQPQNYKDLYGILQLLRSSHLNNFALKTLKLGWVAFHSATFQLKRLDFQSSHVSAMGYTILIILILKLEKNYRYKFSTYHVEWRESKRPNR